MPNVKQQENAKRAQKQIIWTFWCLQKLFVSGWHRMFCREVLRGLGHWGLMKRRCFMSRHEALVGENFFWIKLYSKFYSFNAILLPLCKCWHWQRAPVYSQAPGPQSLSPRGLANNPPAKSPGCVFGTKHVASAWQALGKRLESIDTLSKWVNVTQRSGGAPVLAAFCKPSRKLNHLWASATALLQLLPTISFQFILNSLNFNESSHCQWTFPQVSVDEERFSRNLSGSVGFGAPKRSSEPKPGKCCVGSKILDDPRILDDIPKMLQISSHISSLSLSVEHMMLMAEKSDNSDVIISSSSYSYSLHSPFPFFSHLAVLWHWPGYASWPHNVNRSESKLLHILKPSLTKRVRDRFVKTFKICQNHSSFMRNLSKRKKYILKYIKYIAFVCRFLKGRLWQPRLRLQPLVRPQLDEAGEELVRLVRLVLVHQPAKNPFFLHTTCSPSLPNNLRLLRLCYYVIGLIDFF